MLSKPRSKKKLHFPPVRIWGAMEESQKGKSIKSEYQFVLTNHLALNSKDTVEVHEELMAWLALVVQLKEPSHRCFIWRNTLIFVQVNSWTSTDKTAWNTPMVRSKLQAHYLVSLRASRKGDQDNPFRSQQASGSLNSNVQNASQRANTHISNQSSMGILLSTLWQKGKPHFNFTLIKALQGSFISKQYLNNLRGRED